MIENNLLNLLLNLLRLAQDDIALTLNGGLLKLGVLQNVGQDVDALGHIGVEGLGKIYGVLALQAVLDPFHSHSGCLPEERVSMLTDVYAFR